MIWDEFVLALKNIREKGTRSWLTIIGIFIGVAAVVALISLSQGFSESVEAEFEAAGTDTITIQGGDMRGDSYLDESDVDVVRNIFGVDVAEPILIENAEVLISGETFFVSVDGVNSEIFDQFPQYDIESGRFLRSSESGSVVLGGGVRRNVFEDVEIDIGENLQIDGENFRVIGELEESGDPGSDRSLFISLDKAQDKFDSEDKISTILARPLDTVNVTEVVEEIEEELEDERGDDDFTVQTLEQIQEAVGNIISMVEALFVGIASISLLVGGIGIMNTMYASVLEKTKDIGIMKAVGARNGNILRIFLFQSGLLGLAGGILGVIVGLSLSKGAEYVVQEFYGLDMLSVAVTPEIVIGALLFSFIVGTISGVLPAKRAANLDPVEALRNE